MKLILDCHRHRVQTRIPPDNPHPLVIVLGPEDFRLLQLGSGRGPHDRAQVCNALYHAGCSSVLQ